MGALEYLKADPSKIEHNLAKILLECSRKVDKIILYGLQSTTIEMQMNPFLSGILQCEAVKLQFLLNFDNNKLRDWTELNILAILEGLLTIQSKLPFAFLPFLEQYLQTVIQLLLKNTFQE